MQNRLFQVLGLAIGSATKSTAEYLKQKSVDDLELFRGSWERLVFLLYWFTIVAERRATSKVLAGNYSVSKPAGKPSKGKKGKKLDEDDDIWDWNTRKQMVLVWMNRTLELDLNKIWTLMHEKAPFIG